MVGYSLFALMGVVLNGQVVITWIGLTQKVVRLHHLRVVMVQLRAKALGNYSLSISLQTRGWPGAILPLTLVFIEEIFRKMPTLCVIRLDNLVVLTPIHGD